MPPKKKMKFFKETFGFLEKTRSDGYETTKSKLLEMAIFQLMPTVHGSYPRERCDFTIVNNKIGGGDNTTTTTTTTTISAGIFSFPSVEELQQEVEKTIAANRHDDDKKKKLGRDDGHDKNNNTCSGNGGRPITVRNMVGEARALHMDYPGSIIQAASQFNLLEFPSPTMTPEAGISDYIKDHTQGPACAVACAAGTAYRNYLVPVPFLPLDTTTTSQNIRNDNRGQTKTKQLNGLVDLESYIMNQYSGGDDGSNSNNKSCGGGIPPWRVKNGYVESSRERIQSLNKLLTKTTTTATADKGTESNSEESASVVVKLKEKLERLLRVGVQEDTAVTDAIFKNNNNDDDNDVTVTQVYSSAISVGYSMLPTHSWEPMARIVLNATYKATLLVGVLKALESDNSKPPIVLLTKVGGGVFGNLDEWIVDAISNAVAAVSQYNVDLDVRVVHFGSLDSNYRVLEEN